MGGVSFATRNTVKGIMNEVENIKDFNLDLDLKLIEIKAELKKLKEDYMKEMRESVDYDSSKDAEYEQQWNQLEESILEKVNQKINEIKTRNATAHIISIVVKLILGVGLIGAFYAVSHM